MNKYLWIALVACLPLLLSGQALQAAGDAAAGREKTATCATCHGVDGNNAVPLYPRLAGQGEKYLLQRLQAIQRGDVAAPLMVGQLDDKSAQDLEDIAAWFAGNPLAPGAAATDGVEEGEQIYRFGIPDRGIPACSACHSPTGLGNFPAGYPRLAGQHAAYIVKMLLRYRDGGEIHNETTAFMKDIALGMTKGEMQAVGNYVEGLRVAERKTP